MCEIAKEQQSIIINFLTRSLKAYAIILFGSAAAGKLRQDSDIDLAILSEQPHAPYELFMAAQELADKLNRDVDLIDFTQASTVFQAQIAGKGVLLLDGEPVKRQYLFMRALKEYAMLNEERMEILIKNNFVTGGVTQYDKGHHREQNGNNKALYPENS